jgi:glucose-6-phosphate 1-epimerase
LSTRLTDRAVHIFAENRYMRPEAGAPNAFPSSNQPRVMVQSQGGDSRVLATTYGGQILSWVYREKERLYLSPNASYRPGQAIRGGIPVIFPQFGTRGGGPRHGFARQQEWEHLVSAPTSARFALRESGHSLETWPHPFLATLEFGVADSSLTVCLAITNTSETPLSFTAALHTYLRVSDVESAAILGLQGVTYLDATANDARHMEEAPTLRIDGEIDRVYCDTPDSLTLQDEEGEILVEQAGFTDTVVWNPGAALAERLADLGAGQQAHFVCIEAACIATPVHLEPAATWNGKQKLTVVAG